MTDEDFPPLSIRPVEGRDIGALIELWTASGLTVPHNDPQTDIAFARASADAGLLVGEAAGRIVASVMVGHDGHRGAVYYVCVAEPLRKTGYGREIMAAAEDWLRDRGVWKLNLMVRGSNRAVVGFYESLGYAPEDRVVMSKRLCSSPNFEGSVLV